ncbi:hypothetical protein GX50_04850 [[Emmonsia] crescens]|uniref:Uncharacterized protein n=1 Tax=[Emmonsia] crescens TaxID=73230 RepID=A0A2B7ZGB2_9EURO|nr:hypothetical protein GX50_04850 [Emmonsia crescens]
MKLLPLTTFLSIIATVAAHVPAGGHAADVILNLKNDPHGIKHVGADGIARSYDVRGRVIDSARLTRSQLLAVAKSASSEDERKHLQGLWANVDPSKVDEAELWEPPQHVLPTRFVNPEQHAKKMVDAGIVASVAKAQYDAKKKLQTRFDWCEDVKCGDSWFCELFFLCGPCVELVEGVGHCMPLH